MNITRLASGTYRARVYLGKDENGKQIFKSITGPSKKVVQYEAARLENSHKEAKQKETFESAAEEYFRLTESSLSPSTFKAYRCLFKMMRTEYGKDFCSRDIYTITTKDSQKLIDSLVRADLSPKSIRNYWGFVSSVLTYKEISIQSPKLPQKERADIHVPDEDVVRRTLKVIKDTPLEVPVLLAAFGPLRRGEICALMPEDISGNVVHVRRDMVLDEHNVWQIKTPKTYASDRYIEFPSSVIKKLNALKPDDDGRLIHQNPDQLTDQFRRALKRAGIPHYRFHDLRHFCASYLHAQGVPDIYIMQRTGHSSPAVLRAIYTHTLQDQSKKETEKIINLFDKIME